MDNNLKKKYGLLMAISMVVGNVIGSGIFFKASKVLYSTGSDMIKSIFTVIAVGMIMLVCAYVFSILASKIDKVNGFVDYAEAACGPFYAYSIGWFANTIFYPTITSCLGWISANYIIILFGIDLGWWFHYLLAAILLCLSFLLNTFAPNVSGKFQISTTALKLVPLLLMAVVGTCMGLFNGITAENLSLSTVDDGENNLFGAIVAFAFAYEGWIFATTINAEIRDSKKNLPRALFFGAIIVICVYVFYFIGLMGVLPVREIIDSGDDLPKVAFSALFGRSFFGSAIYVFVVISCLGTMNGLMLATSRGMYSIAVRGEGIRPDIFIRLNKKTGMPMASAVFGLSVCLFWLTQWQLGFINGYLPDFIAFENDELPIITFYAGCIPIFIYVIRKGKDLGVMKRFVFPILASLACVFMIFCAVYTYRIDALYYIIVFVVIMLIGFPYYKKRKKN